MTKLYYSHVTVTDPPFVQTFSAGIQDLECVQVDLNDYTTIHGDDFYNINPSGALPCLVLSNGSIVEEKTDILEFILDYHVSVFKYSCKLEPNHIF
jgi:glutathione S-transferase